MAKKTNTKGVFSIFREYCQRTMAFFKEHNVQFIIGILLVAIAIFLCSSFISFFSIGGNDQSVIEGAMKAVGENVENASGKSGAVVANFLVNKCFGWASLLLLPLLVLTALYLMRLFEIKLRKWVVSLFFSMIWLSLLFSSVFGDMLAASYVSPGGLHGDFLKSNLLNSIGVVGLILVLVVSLLFFMIYLSRDTIVWLKKMLSPRKLTEEEVTRREKNLVINEETCDEINTNDEKTEECSELIVEVAENEVDNEDDFCDHDIITEEEENLTIEEVNEEDVEETILDDEELAARFDIVSQRAAQNAETGDAVDAMEVEEAAGDDDMGGNMFRPINPKDELSYYKPPTIDLLDEYEQTVHSIDKEEQAANANKIVEVLKNFGIEISSIKATVGPTITLYEITPAPGIRISKIRNLEDDIAMSLSALCIRIVAPIPGKGAIGVEVPNAHKQIVPMASLLNSRKYKETDMALPLALGKTISNEVYMVDMAKMPHLLVAGATGMGKSVGLNAIITSLLYKMHPAYLKFVMVDPKMVELSLYSVLEKHFLAKLEGENEPIITDVNRVVRTLKSLCVEMDNRYKLLQLASVRSVKEYNEKFINKELLPTKGHRFMPYIVVIIDEYGDLMMTAGREVEQPIARIAQKARAVGIHMIIATQRPTTNIITGTIKANFPARMAFRVISVIDSRTILDRSGANQLQGRGDMLFLAGNDPVRVQCALVETKEVERVCAHIAKQQGYQTAYILPEPDETFDAGGEGGVARGDISSDKLDPLFADAARAVVLAQHGSTSLIQRKFNVGFNRAGRIMDQLCQTGIVGEQEGSKPRQVLCADEADLEFRLKSLL